MLTQQRVHSGSHAGIRDKGHFNLGSALELFEAKLKLATGTDARQRQAAGFGARRIKQIGERAIRGSAIDDDECRRTYEVANRLKAGQWMVVQLSQLRIDDK